ncbi:hypothetical protein EVA_03730 [gut metagenome]|uniref:Uncharacterized protein n=1 Tax=gut metagenome TaxID=749906 RepID=J9D629_9ZZZZ
MATSNDGLVYHRSIAYYLNAESQMPHEIHQILLPVAHLRL